MKLNKYFTLCYSLYFNILHYPRVFTHLAPHLYFPFPTESRSKNRKSLVIKDFRFSLLHFWRVFGEIYRNLIVLIRHKLIIVFLIFFFCKTFCATL